MEPSVPKTLEELAAQKPRSKGGRPRVTAECVSCGKITAEWVLKRIEFYRHMDGKQRSYGGYSGGRHCVECVAREVAEHGE